MKTTDSSVVMGKWPTHEDWMKAEGLLLEEISRSKKQNNCFVRFNFFEFMACVLFFLEKVGVRKLVGANDTMDHLEKIYHDNGLFYSSRIFRGAWSDIDTLGMIGNGASPAKCFLGHLDEIGMISSACGRENISLWSISDRGNEETRKLFRRDLESACCILRCEKNRKYISQIRWMAYALLKAMHEENEKNNR